MSSHSCWYESIGISPYKTIDIINSVGEAHPPAPRETRHHAGQAHAVHLPSRPRVKSTRSVNNPGREGGHTQYKYNKQALHLIYPRTGWAGGCSRDGSSVGSRIGAAPRPVRWTVSRRLSSGMRSLRTHPYLGLLARLLCPVYLTPLGAPTGPLFCWHGRLPL